MKCEGCGAEVTAKFCPYCGHEMPTNQSVTIINNYYQAPTAPASQPRVTSPKPQVVYRDVVVDNVSPCNKWVDFWLCFFLGFFGVHKFYEGKIGTGLLYIFTFGICGLGVLVDMLIILGNGAKDKSGRKIR